MHPHAAAEGDRDIFRLQGIRHRYGRRDVLHGVSISAGPGIYGLLGNNGAGKSTLLKISATVLPTTAGKVSFEDLKRPRDDQGIRRRLGYLPQEYGLPLHLTCIEYLRYVAAMKGLHAEESRTGPQALLQRFGLEDAATRRIRALSGGMRQRLGLAQAFLGRPRLIILDEPSAGLDPQERVRLRGVMRELAQDATILLSTHIVSDVEREAQRIGILHGGRLVAEGTPEELIAGAAGRVYEVQLDRAEWQRLSQEWMRRDRDLRKWPGVVAGVTAPDEGFEEIVVRVVSLDAPSGPVRLVAPTLEDAYLLATTLGQGREQTA